MATHHMTYTQTAPLGVYGGRARSWRGELNQIVRVLDVFVSRKERNANPLQFAFARFAPKIRALYEHRGRLNLPHGVPQEPDRSKPEVGKTSDGRKRSYSEAVKGDDTNKGVWKLRDDNSIHDLTSSKVMLGVDEKMVEKLQRSLVGESFNPIHFEAAMEDIRKVWPNVVELNMMGSRKMVMVFETAQNIEEVEITQELRNHFTEIRKWSPSDVVESRRTWVEVIGLPLHAWGKEDMLKIGGIRGSVIRVDEMDFNSFHMLIDTSLGPLIQARLAIEVEGVGYVLFIKEIGVVDTYPEIAVVDKHKELWIIKNGGEHSKVIEMPENEKK
ncbi:hypothetical protein PIB30_017983 [Stylosanthes scabra]|uniref:DUF4283 domain-containing protein n=1 Tax=Stylosanthes scabra TaxID=79078 RepID=A0ABU6UAG2_9FABA|nr:hypothetical protein [Stylosanthes scabra]